MRVLPVTAAGLCALVGLSGCVQEPAPICNMSAISAQQQLVAVPPPLGGTESPLIEMPMNSVSITDHAIIQKLYVRQVAAQRTPTGTVEVVSQIINCTDYPQNAEARVQFYDAAQIASEPVSAWKRFHLSPRTSNTWRESSIGTSKARYYMVEVRETK